MRKMLRVALVMGMTTMSATAVQAEEPTAPTEDMVTTQIVVVNNYRTDVRIYIEDADGRLHHVRRLARGEVADFNVPESLARDEFRVKVFPATPIGSLLAGDPGIKTNPLRSPRDHQVRMWLEADLPSSFVEVAR